MTTTTLAPNSILRLSRAGCVDGSRMRDVPIITLLDEDEDVLEEEDDASISSLDEDIEEISESSAMDSDVEVSLESQLSSASAERLRRSGATSRGGRRTAQRHVLVVPNSEVERRNVIETSGITKENSHLKEILLSQLRLIQQQSEDIVNKDRQLRQLQKENEELKNRLREMESARSLEADQDKSQPESESSVGKEGPTGYCFRTRTEESKAKSPSTPGEKDYQNSQKTTYLETDMPYFVLQGEDFVEGERQDVKSILTSSEVPGWRINSVATSYSLEGTEDIENETLLRRHGKPEADEKRRKRWDIQRLREQWNVQRLKARYDKAGHPKGTRKADQASEALPNAHSRQLHVEVPQPCVVDGRRKKSQLSSLQPVAECATHISVTERLPIVAFGHQLPVLAEVEFALPWKPHAKHLTVNASVLKKAKTDP